MVWRDQDVVWKTGSYHSVPGGIDYGVPRLLFQLRVEYQDRDRCDHRERWKLEKRRRDRFSKTTFMGANFTTLVWSRQAGRKAVSTTSLGRMPAQSPRRPGVAIAKPAPHQGRQDASGGGND